MSTTELDAVFQILMSMRSRMEADKYGLNLAKKWGTPDDVATEERALAESTKTYNDALALFVKPKDKAATP